MKRSEKSLMWIANRVATDAAEAAASAAAAESSAADAADAAISAVLGSWPTGDNTAVTFVNDAGYGLGRLTADGIEDATTAALEADMATVIDLPDGFGVWPTGGDPVIVNEAGYATGIVGGDGASASSSDTATDEQVASVFDGDVGDVPLLPYENNFFGYGESKAVGVNGVDASYQAIVTDQGATLPVGASLSCRVDGHPGHDMAELAGATDIASMRSTMDAAFTGGAECVSTEYLICMCNDMIAGTNPVTWEETTLEVVDQMRRYALQKYVGTDPAARVPVPPVGMIVDCTWGQGAGRTPLIPLRAIAMARRIFEFGVIVPDYICEMAANQGDVASDDTGVHWTLNDIALIEDYIGLWSYYWRHLNKKYTPTQVVDGWTDGNDFYLQCEMPHAPLVADTALVSSIADNGLVGITSDGTTVTLSSLSIVGGGRIIKGTASSSLAGGGRIRGGYTPTTAGRSGKVNGARLMYRDSSPYVGASGNTLYSPMMPFDFTFA